jgi:hypothetical protein
VAAAAAVAAGSSTDDGDDDVSSVSVAQLLRVLKKQPVKGTGRDIAAGPLYDSSGRRIG